MKLVVLGGLKVEDCPLTRPKPLLLLAYLAVEGSRDRRDLAELFFQGTQDPAQGLRVALSHLNKEASGALRSHEKRLWTELPSDLTDLETLLAQERYQEALELYKGPFLEGLDAESEELEEWLYQKRERVAGQVREAFLKLAEQEASSGHFAGAANRAEQAYLLRFAPEPEIEMLERIYMLLRAGGNAQGDSVAKEAKSYGLELSLSVSEARAKLQTLPKASERIAANPYLGLFAFQEKDAPFFYGREDAATDIVQFVQRSPYIVTLIGNSGAGKSSLVFAGVLPQLRQEGWCIASLRPGRQPFDALALVLTELLGNLSEREQLLESQELAQDLQQEKLLLATVAEEF